MNDQRRREQFLAAARSARAHSKPLHSCDSCGKMCYRSRTMARRAMSEQFPGERMNAYVACSGDGFHIGHLPRAIRTGATTRQAKYGAMQ